MLAVQTFKLSPRSTGNGNLSTSKVHSGFSTEEIQILVDKAIDNAGPGLERLDKVKSCPVAGCKASFAVKNSYHRHLDEKHGLKPESELHVRVPDRLSEPVYCLRCQPGKSRKWFRRSFLRKHPERIHSVAQQDMNRELSNILSKEIGDIGRSLAANVPQGVVHLDKKDQAALDIEKQLEKRKSKLRWLKIEQKLVELDIEVQSALPMERPDPDRCITALDELNELAIVPLMLKKHLRIIILYGTEPSL